MTIPNSITRRLLALALLSVMGLHNGCAHEAALVVRYSEILEAWRSAAIMRTDTATEPVDSSEAYAVSKYLERVDSLYSVPAVRMYFGTINPKVVIRVVLFWSARVA